jgi:hypothetical protein
MCLIAIQDENRLSKEDFEKAFERNDDGVGFAWTKDGKSHFAKGFMDVISAWEFQSTLELPFVTHFRKKSIGEVCPELTHPFIISKESPLDLKGETEKGLLFMNGSTVWWEEYLNATGRYKEDNEKISDARALAIIISNDNEKFLKKINAKFVVVDPVTPRFWFYGTFTEENGILYSNNEWKWKNCSKKKTEKVNQNLTNTCSQTSTYNYKKPWESQLDLKHRILRFLLNRMTEKSGLKLWNRYQKKQKLENALERAIKIVKQQDKDFSEKLETRIRHFIKADAMEFPDRTNYLINNGIKTSDFFEDRCQSDNSDKIIPLQLTFNPVISTMQNGEIGPNNLGGS